MSGNLERLRARLNAARKERGEPPLAAYRPVFKFCGRLPPKAKGTKKQKGRQGDS